MSELKSETESFTGVYKTYYQTGELRSEVFKLNGFSLSKDN